MLSLFHCLNWNLFLWSQESSRDKDLSSAFLRDLFCRTCCHSDDTIYPQSIWQCSMTICFTFSLGIHAVSKWHTWSYHFGSPQVQYRSLLSTNCDLYQLLWQMNAFLHCSFCAFYFSTMLLVSMSWKLKLLVFAPAASLTLAIPTAQPGNKWQLNPTC